MNDICCKNSAFIFPQRSFRPSSNIYPSMMSSVECIRPSVAFTSCLWGTFYHSDCNAQAKSAIHSRWAQTLCKHRMSRQTMTKQRHHINGWTPRRFMLCEWGCPPIVCICLFRCFFDYPWRRGGVQRSCLRTSRVVCWVSTHVYVSLYFVSHVNRSTISVLWHRNECFFINLNERIKNVCATHRPAPLFSHGNVYINGSRDCVDGSQLAGHDDIQTGDDVHALVTDFLCLPIWWVKDFVLWYRVWQIQITL